MAEAKQVRAIVRGRVQGVCFRAWTRETAEQLGLAGWVRNCPDGSVELFAQGDAADLEKFLGLCEKGPPAAQVANVERHWESKHEVFSGFEIRR